jgi:hypothetical protein
LCTWSRCGPPELGLSRCTCCRYRRGSGGIAVFEVARIGCPSNCHGGEYNASASWRYLRSAIPSQDRALVGGSRGGDDMGSGIGPLTSKPSER